MSAEAHILVIDDEPSVRNLLTYTLSQAGYWVVTAASAREGIERMPRSTFDLILLDLRMPDMEGLEALQAIQEVNPSIPVVMIAGHATVEMAVACLKAGATDFIQKPFEIERLRMIIRREIERRRLSSVVALYETGITILETHDPDVLLPRVVKLAMKALQADDASLMQTEEDGSLRLAYSHTLGRPEQPLVAPRPGVAIRVLELGEPVLLEDGLQADPRFADLARRDVRIRSSIVHPLYKDGRLLGVLNINRIEDPEPFTRRDLQQATVLASMIALSLDNARLFQQLQARVADLSSTQSQLIHSEKMAAFGQLAAGVAHEINNPAAFICTNLTQLRQHMEQFQKVLSVILAGGSTDEARAVAREAGIADRMREVQEILDETSIGFGRIVDTVDDLRSFARIGERAPLRFPLQLAVDSAVRMCRNELQQRGQLTVQLPPDIEVVGDQSQLSQVFLNLLLNAAQALDQGRYDENRVEVTLVRDELWAEVHVRDSGAGIPAGDLARVFDPFYTTKSSDRGTGLGLTISREIARRHGGSVEVQSEVGQGSCFTVRLPVASSDASRHPPCNDALPSPVDERPMLRPLHLLVVDDEPALLRSLSRGLGRRHQVVTAHGGEAALRLLQDDPEIEAVICDLLMPGLTGMDVYEHAVRHHPHLRHRFVFLTGDAFTPAARTFAEAHRGHVMLKPFDIGQLERMLASVVPIPVPPRSMAN